MVASPGRGITPVRGGSRVHEFVFSKVAVEDDILSWDFFPAGFDAVTKESARVSVQGPLLMGVNDFVSPSGKEFSYEWVAEKLDGNFDPGDLLSVYVSISSFTDKVFLEGIKNNPESSKVGIREVPKEHLMDMFIPPTREPFGF